tara:strand:- start:83 stop:1012 length:930 start_codon:yes stop_codon:yes gene_type:complete
MGFPKSTDIFGSNPNRNSILDIRDTIARPSLDTFYEVNFTFGKSDVWLGEVFNRDRRTQSNGFRKKMSLLCSQAEIPGTSFVPSTAVGHHQGIQEEFPNLRNFPPLNLVFYCDADQIILQVLETWMSYINPVATDLEAAGAYAYFNYPEDYKEDISITKFERDSFVSGGGRGRGGSGTDAQGRDFDDPNAFKQGINSGTSYKSHYAQFKFKNVWPSNLTSMRVAYGDSNVLRCNVQFSYDRFFTSFTKNAENTRNVLNSVDDIINSNETKEAVERQQIYDDLTTPQYKKNRNKLNASRRDQGRTSGKKR